MAFYHGKQKTRLGLAIAKKQVRKAVDRNRIKRLIRESFRNNKEILQGFDIVVMTRTSDVHVNNAELFESLRKHWLNLNSKNQA